MQWHDWNEAAFERARERNSPVLLFLRTSWCHWCRQLEQHSFADERVRSILSESFVCVQVDKDEHPEIDTRYRGSGWPSLCWLDSEGQLLARDGYLEAEELAQRARRVSEAYPSAPQSEVLEAPEPAKESVSGRRPRSTDLSLELVEDVMNTLLETADPDYGGWGKHQKFPHPEALHFAVVRWSQTGRSEVLELVLNTLRHMQAGEIYDRVEGGFYRYATAADWSRPNYEKPLDSNSQRLLAYIEAYQALGEPGFRSTAEGILGWMRETLLDEDTGAFRCRQDADPEYAHKSTREQREAHGRPATDPKLYTNWNAMAARSLLKAAVVFDDESLAAQAGRTLDFLVDKLFDPKAGVYHYWDGTYNLPGRVSDHAYLLRSLVEAMHYIGANRYLQPARAIASFALQYLQQADGTFQDAGSPPGDGLHREARWILENAVLAESLVRLSHMTRDANLAEQGRRTLEAFLPEYRQYGQFTAGYGRAVDLLVHQPVHVIVVGEPTADSTRALRRAALQPYVASRIVQTIDPTKDEELLALSDLPVPHAGQARAYVQQGQESYAETSRPERLAALMARAERSN